MRRAPIGELLSPRHKHSTAGAYVSPERSEKQEAAIPGPPRHPHSSFAPLLPFRTPGPYSGACPGRNTQDSPRTANGWIPRHPFLSANSPPSSAIPLTHALRASNTAALAARALSLCPVTSVTRRPGREPRAKNTKGGPRPEEHAPSPSSAAWGLAHCVASRGEIGTRGGTVERATGRES